MSLTDSAVGTGARPLFSSGNEAYRAYGGGARDHPAARVENRTRRCAVHEVELYEQNQGGPDENIALSPEEKTGGVPVSPTPGVERAGDNEVKHEINPNTE